MGRKKWQRPMLTVLVRPVSGEAVLHTCKSATETGGPDVYLYGCELSSSIGGGKSGLIGSIKEKITGRGVAYAASGPSKTCLMMVCEADSTS